MSIKQVAYIFIGILFLISSCSKTGSNSYYPTRDGMIWEYQKYISNNMGSSSGKKVKVTNFPFRELNNVKVFPRKYDEDGKAYFAFVNVNDNGYCIYAIQNSTMGEPKILDQAYYFIKLPIHIGTKWEGREPTATLNDKVGILMSYEIQSITDVVTVPAGTFNNCLKIKGVGRGQKSMGIFGMAEVSKERTLWFSPGIGWIKEFTKESSNNLLLGSGTMAYELESYKN